MAKGGTDRFLRRRSHGDDRLSALSDDLLLLILRRLDTRSALRTGLLSRRWSCLPRELTAFDFRVSDVLPPRYHRWIHLYLNTKETPSQYRLRASKEKLLPNIGRYERRAMRSLTSFLQSFLDAAGARRRVRRLSLEFFSTRNTGCINQFIAKAIDAWGVTDLEAVASPIYMEQTVHAFPIHGLCEEPHASRLARLKLGGCVLPPLHEYSKLTTLVLQSMPESTSDADYGRVFTSCPQLKVLHLISCHYGGAMVVDAPRSNIRELVVDRCAFAQICLRALPSLESLASLGTRVFFESTSFPCLRRCNFALCLGDAKDEGLRQYFARLLKLKLGLFFRRTPDITNLIIRFTGPGRWIIPSSFTSPLLPNLKRLLVADLPSSWDASWPRLLLETAPSLETFHIHIAPCLEEPGDEIPWQPTVLRHHKLKEFVMVGFQGAERQAYLVKFVMTVCTALNHAAVFKKGYTWDKGQWDWKMVTQPQAWTDDEKQNLLKKIVDGVSSSTASVQLVFG